MDIVKIAVLGIAGVFLAIPLKREKGEYSTFVAMVVGICIFIYLLTKVETVLLFVDSIKSQLPVDSRYIGLVVKMVGLCRRQIMTAGRGARRRRRRHI